jgi:hypothetical protein
VLGVVAAARRALADLGAGGRERLAHLERHERGGLLGLGVEQVGGGAHPPGPLGVGRAPVAPERRGARASRSSSSASDSGSKVRTTSPVAGSVVAIAMRAPRGRRGSQRP